MVSIPFASGIIASANAQTAVVCCDDAHNVELYMTGSSTGQLTPFSQLLDDDGDNAEITNSITSQETVGTWSFGRVWPGSWRK